MTSDITFDQRMDRICGSLHKHGYEVTIICRRFFKDQHTEKPYQVICLNNVFRSGKLFYLEHNLRLLFRLLFIKTDIICSIDLDTIVPGYWVSKWRRKKLVYDAHEYFTEVIEVVNRKRVQKIWQYVERKIVPHLKHAYTVNDSLANLFQTKYKTNFGVIRNIAELKPNVANVKKEFDLIYIGAVNAGRGIKETIDAIKGTGYTFKICGGGDILNELKEYVISQNMSQQVVFKGLIEPSELVKETCSARLGILLLDNISLSYYYSLANKFFDYIHAEIPQITSNFPEYATLLSQHNVGVTCSYDSKEIRKVITQTLNDEVTMNTLTSNCKKAKLEWNWAMEEKKLLRFYQDL